MEICKITPARRADDAAWLSSLIAQYDGPVTVVEGCKFERPPERRDWIDPQYTLRRQRKPSPREVARMIAAHSCVEDKGVEVVLTAFQVAKVLQGKGVAVDTACVEQHAREYGLRLRNPSERRAPQQRSMGSTKQARRNAVLREEWK